ncbi:hypothetical protein [uncultured Polaribacter sp.]|uniref:hypothetical protein n=1 Tax=uncultured Polaribacter sp. TaxID=174711 RepID=UPI002628CC12|nr:hypothetical protein [uncultured Polaribacter sp.]
MVGVGNNLNFLASSFFDNTLLISPTNNNQRFRGLGFGFEKEFLPKKLNTFNQRLGKLLMRFSKNNNSLNIQFKNDFRGGNLFLGEGTDFGSTGALMVSYSKIINAQEIFNIGIALSLFTPKPDYSKTPNNLINSDDGSKNVWHTKPPYPNLFYANAFVFGNYQKNNFSSSIKAGLNSQKLGAFTQNILHDSFGLNPRFPWKTDQKDKLFIELNTGILKTISNE